MRRTTLTRNRGVTLFELMLTLAVAAVLAAIAIPNMRDFIRNNRITAVANDLLRSMQVARSEAIKRQRRVVMCASENPSAATPSCSDTSFHGWIVFEDTNSDWTVNDGEQIIERHDLVHASLSVINDNDSIFSFAPTGFPTPDGTKVAVRNIVVCDERGNQQIAGNSSAARAVMLVERTGRFRVSRTVEDVDRAIDATGTTCPP
ncbi:MAG TPA: GspH/FimT family pseudopilin [Steroidobacteraceae bacterium]